MSTSTGDLEANQSEGVHLVASLEERVFVATDESAKLDSAEVLHDVFQAHKEGSVILISPASELLRLRSPGVRVITPITLPLEVTPRVPQLN